MKWLRKRMRTMFSRTVFVMLVISLTVLVATAMGLFVWFRTEMIEGYYTLTHSVMKNTDAEFARNLKDAKGMIMDWYDSADVVRFRLQNDVDPVEHLTFINSVQNTFRRSDYLQSFGVVNKEKEISLYIGSNVSNTERLDPLLLDKVKEKNVKNQSVILNVKKYRSDHETVPLLMIPIADAPVNDEHFSGMAFMNIDLRALNKNLFSDYHDDQFRLYIFNQDGVVVGNSEQSSLGEDWSDKAFTQRIIAGEKRFEIKEGGKRWEILAEPSLCDGYWIAVQFDYVTQILNINSTIYVIMNVLIAAILIVSFLTILSARRIFEPFHNVVGKLKQADIIDTAGEEYDEITFLENYYHSISGQMQILNEKKEKDFIVKNLLLGTQSREIKLLMHQKGILVEHMSYSMVLIFIESAEQKDKLSMQEYDLLRNMTESAFAAAFEQYGKCTSFEVGLRRILFLISGEEKQQKQIAETIQRVSASLKKQIAVRVYGMYTNIFQDDGQGGLYSFRRLNGYLRTRQLLDCTELAVLPEKDRKWTESSHEKVIECLRKRDKTGYMDAAERILKDSEMLQYDHFVHRLELLVKAILKAGKITRYTAEEYENHRTDKVREYILSLSGRDEVLLWLESMYSEAALQVEKETKTSITSVMEEAVDYIRNNYDDNSLSVNALADKLKVTPSYFGKMFTEFTGVRMLDYVLQVRMEKARELLIVESGKDIAQIAALVGYNNSTYFATAFKKYYGMTPSSFRELYLAEKLREESGKGENKI